MSKLPQKPRGLKLLSALLGLFLPLFTILTTVVALTTPVYAVPGEESSEGIDLDDPDTLAPTDETTPDDGTDPETTPADGTEAETTEEDTSEEDEESTNTCYDQTGALGWFICPLASVISGAVDTVYNLIEEILIINPVSTNPDSPVYMVWDYLRRITNVVFIIMLLIAIMSQLTGLGISNYGIKKMLPRLVVAAIVINLSFIVCQLAVDVSNITGMSIKNFLDSMTEEMIATADPAAANLGWGDLLVGILGGAATIGGVAIATAVAGGLIGLFWLLLPILIAAFLAVIVGLLTIVFRQGLVMLLIMVSPLAIVAYMLPNTEKWFDRWRQLLIQMLFFYPMFAFLFGASALAGWVLILSADSVFWVIIGLAIQVIPLFLAFSLMKMSGTILGRLSGAMDRLRGRAVAPARGWAASHQQVAKAKYLSSQPKAINIPRRVSQNFARRRFRRAYDAGKYTEAFDAENKAFANNYYNSAGKLTKRGARLLAAENSARYASARALQAEDEHDNLTPAKFAPTLAGSVVAPLGQRQKNRYDRLSDDVTRSYDTLSDYQKMSAYNKIQAATDHYQRSYKANVEALKGNITDRYTAMRQAAGSAGQEGINSILSQAAAEQIKLEQSATGDFETFCKAVETNGDIEKLLNTAFDSKNSVLLSAVVKTCGDTKKYNILENVLMKRSQEIAGNDTTNLKMQSALANALMGIKDHALLGNYATIIWKTRGISESVNLKNEEKRANGEVVAVEEDMEPFFSFADYVNSAERPTKFGLDAFSDISTSDKADLFTSQYGAALEFIRKNDIGSNFTPAQIINGVFMNPSHGSKQLKRIDNLLGTKGKWDKQREVLTFNDEAALADIRSKYQAVVERLSPSNFAQFDMRSLSTYASIFADDKFYTTTEDGKRVINNQNPDERYQHLFSGLERILEICGKRAQVKRDFERREERGQLDNMDSDVRDLFSKIFGLDRRSETPDEQPRRRSRSRQNRRRKSDQN